MTVSVLFVCLGNICRSPMAEGALRALADERDLELGIDSAGTGDWHVGQPPDGRARATADANGVDISAQSARQIAAGDFARFDHIVAMDCSVLADIRRMAPSDTRAEISLFLDHVPGRAGEDVADPYYGEDDGFEAVWRDIVQGAEALIEKIADRR